jgi:hypothetical protein
MVATDKQRVLYFALLGVALLSVALITVVVGAVTFLGLIPPVCIGPVRGPLYLLDGRAFYPGPLYHGTIQDKEIVLSYEDLVKRIAALAPGTTIFYSEVPGMPASERMLGHWQFIRITWFCQTRRIRFVNLNIVNYLERMRLCRN